MAVNAYDESRAVVEKFVADARLTHPILLMGGKPAKERYFCSAYPTTHQSRGQKCRSQMGFDAEQLPAMTRIEQLLDAGK
ncbi:MAG: hypothetical protein U1E76_20090 [Planctomycetota bacterium]